MLGISSSGRDLTFGGGVVGFRKGSSLALLDHCNLRSGARAFASVVVVVSGRGMRGAGGSSSSIELLSQTAPHSLRVFGVLVTRVKSSLVPVDLQSITVREGELSSGVRFTAHGDEMAT